MNEKICVEWKNLNYTVKKKPDKRFWQLNRFNEREETLTILDNVSGYVESGTLTAIIGGSGAGKTTLLASISQRIRGKLTGNLEVNGCSVTQNEMTKLSGFVSQYDITIDSLTAREHLIFMAEMKMGRKVPKVTKTRQINYLLNKLGLARSADVKISNLSGGERKKLNLATELLTEPPILFCDEPTTGLDSYNALSVIKTLKQLATKSPDVWEEEDEERAATAAKKFDQLENGNQYLPLVEQKSNSLYSLNESAYVKVSDLPKVILCSIHQPASDVFHCFTHIILMQGGRILYQGSTEEASIFFSKLGYHCPLAYNPAEFYMNLASISSEQPKHSLLKIQRIFEQYEDEKTEHHCQFTLKSNYLLFEECVSPNWFIQVYLLLKRSLMAFRNSYRRQCMESLLFVVTGFIIAILYKDVPPHFQKSIQDIKGAIFIMSTEALFTFSYGVMYLFPTFYPLLRRETGEKLYTISAFYVSKILLLIPRCFLEVYIFVGIVYFSVDFAFDLWTYIQLSFSLTIGVIAASAYGCMISSFSDSPRVVTELSAPIETVLLLSAGLYLNVNSMPYLKYLSYFFYANEAMSINYWLNVDSIDCYANLPCLHNGTEVLQALNFGTTHDQIYADYIGLACLIFGFHLIAFLGVRRLIRKTGFY